MAFDFKKASAAANRRLRTKKTTKASRAALPGGVPGAPSVAGTDRRKGVSDNAFGRAIGAAPSPGLGKPRTLKNPTPLVTPSKPGGKRKPKKKPAGAAAPSGTSRATTTASQSTRAAVSSPPSASNPSAGAGAAATRRTVKQNKKAARGGGSPAPTTGPSPVTPSVDDPITGLYAAANRDLERRQQLADATRLARLADQKKFDDWVMAQRGTTDQTLKDAFAKSSADAAAERQRSYDMINQYATEATRQANGMQDILKQAGASADQASFGFQSKGDAVSNAGGAFNQAALSQLQNQQSDVDRARAANMVASYNAQNFAAQQKLAEEGAQLKVGEMKDRISQRNADRQFQLDEQAAQFLQGLKEQELGIKDYAARTDRIVGTLNAKAKAEANRIREMVAQGTLDYKKADLQLKRKGYQLAKRKQILAEAKQQSGNTNKLRQDASTFITKWNSDNLSAQGIPAAPRGDEGIAYARSAVGALVSRWPGLKATDAVDMLRSILPGDVLNDNRVLSAIAGSFR